MEMRAATLGDAAAIAQLVFDCFCTYRTFMGDDWEPPTREDQAADLEQRLPGVGVRTRIAVAAPGARFAAICGWMPARTEEEPRDPVPGLAHLWMLFVDRPHWGSGLASELLDWARTGMMAAAYDTARLWTPTGQARARAFYERRGWYATGRKQYNPGLGLDVTEYRLQLE
jgi:GNAT superfamily N-acetyltransferase